MPEAGRYGIIGPVDAPKYRTIRDQLKDEILGGRYGCRNPFPSETALARRFKTGRSTVKRALNDLAHLGLISSQQGRGTFVTKRGASRKIGLIVPGMAYSEFFPPIVNEISRLSQLEGYTLLFGAITSKDPGVRAQQARRFAEEFIDEGVSGVIYQPLEFISDMTERNREITGLFTSAGIPVVLACADFVEPPDRSGYDVVGINNVAAGSLMARHLLSAGARRVHFLMRPNRGMSVRDRCRGLMSTLRESGGKGVVFSAEPDDVKALRRHLAKGRPDAFVCGSDSEAARFKLTLEAAGLAVPEDMSLAGFNDVQIASLLSPPLTSVRIPCREIAMTAFCRLLARIADPDLPSMECLLPVALAARASTEKPRKERRRK